MSETLLPLVSMSTKAVSQVKKLLQKRSDESKFLRVYIQGGGCSGFQYGFQFDYTCEEDDYLIPHGEVDLVVDHMSFQYLEGAEIDFKDDLMGSRFLVNNPNASSTCGCGSSFSI